MSSRPVPKQPLSVARCREIDRYAIQELGVPGVVLMENAGRNAADLIARWALAISRRGRDRREAGAGRGQQPAGGRRVSIVCGRGNNGGDGFVVARHLYNRGLEVEVDLAAEPGSLAGDAAINYRIIERMGIPVHLAAVAGDEVLEAAAVERWRRSDILVDALLGTGFSGAVREPLRGLIEQINALTDVLKVAIDVPSGLNADTGEPGGVAIRADRTITFLAAKPAYKKRSVRAYAGRIHVVDIGAPVELILARLPDEAKA